MYTAAVLCTHVPVALIALVFSQMNPRSAIFIHHLVQVPRSIGISLLTVFVIGASFVYISRRTLPIVAYWVLWWLLLGVAVAAAVLLLPQHPCSTVPSIIVLGPVLMHAMRRGIYADLPTVKWCRMQSFATGFAAVTSMALWVAWLSIGFPGRTRWYDWPGAFGIMVVNGTITWKLAFVLWASPAGNAMLMGLLSVIYWVRQHYLSLQEEGDRQAFVGFAFKQLLGWLVALAMLVWIGASISATEERKDLRDETVYMAFWIFVCLGVWIIATYGDEVIAGSPRTDSKAAIEVWKVLHNEWVRAFIFLLGALPIGVYVAAYCIVARVRGHRPPWPLFEHLSHWHWTSVFVKATWIGLIYVVFVVLAGKVIMVALSMTGDALSHWPVLSVSAVVFLIGFAVFMFPSAPAAPVYVLMGVVITQSADRKGWRYEAGLAWATFVTFAMKMAFTAAAQKWIGEPLGDRVWVRRCIGIHTPYMRAVEQILQEAMSLAKVAVLVGGPDWPVAVLCGILKLPALPVQVGISPVLVQSVFPCVLCGNLMYFQNTDPGGRDGVPKVASLGLAEVTLLLAAIMQFATGLVAFVCVQSVLEKDYERLATPRPEDEELIEMDELEEQKSLLLHRMTRWRHIPMHLKATLLVGFVCIELCLLLLSGPWHDLFGVSCFRSFDLMTSVDESFGGNPFAIVNPLGWVAFGLAGASGLALGLYHYYSYLCEVEIDSSEATPMLKSASGGDGRA